MLSPFGGIIQDSIISWYSSSLLGCLQYGVLGLRSLNSRYHWILDVSVPVFAGAVVLGYLLVSVGSEKQKKSEFNSCSNKPSSVIGYLVVSWKAPSVTGVTV